MECRAFERVAPLLGSGCTTGNVDAVLSILVARATRHGLISGCKRQTPSIVHGAPRDLRSHIKHTLVVLKPANLVSLDTEVRFDNITVGAQNLNAEERRHHSERPDTKHGHNRLRCRPKRIRGGTEL